jgi:hypothetical protein
MSLPPLTPQQRADALLKAAQSRRERSDALAKVTEGATPLADALTDKDSPLQRAFVRQVLRALKGVGPARAAEAMTAIGIPDKRRVSGLGARQIAALVDRFALVDA